VRCWASVDAALQGEHGERVEAEGEQRGVRPGRRAGRGHPVEQVAQQQARAVGGGGGAQPLGVQDGRSGGRGGQLAAPGLGEPPGAQLLGAAGPLDLAAGRLRHAARGQQHDQVDGDLVLPGDGLADRAGEGLDVDRAGGRVAAELVRDDQAFRVAVREGRAAPGAQQRGGALGGELQVLRVVVAPADDDRVLAAAGDEQLALAPEAEVTGAQERALAGGQPRPERLPGVVRPLPVALRDVRPGDPDLADAAVGQCGVGPRIDHDDLAARPGAAARDQLGRALRGRHGGALPQRGRVEAVGGGPVPRHQAGDHEARLGEAVARVERLGPEAGRGERLGERAQGGRPDRLGPVEGQLPVAQVELGPLLRGGLADAQVVAEVGAAADRRRGLRHGPQPGQRVLEEGRRRHQGHREAGVERLEDAADQAHVVVGRQPDDRPAARRGAERLPDQGRVGQQVGVGEQHAARPAGRPGGVLEHRDGAGIGGRLRLGAGVAEVVDREAAQPGQLGHRTQHGRHGPGDLGGGEQHPGPAVAGLGDQARQAAVQPGRVGRIGRHRDGTAVEAAEERGHVVEAGGIEQQHPFAAAAGRGQRRGDPAGAAIELRVADGGRGPVVAEERVGRRARLLPGAFAQQGRHRPETGLTVIFHADLPTCSFYSVRHSTRTPPTLPDRDPEASEGNTSG
jgi:hypothetical protein